MSTTLRTPEGRSAVMEVRCDGCGKTARADLTSDATRGLISWTRIDGRDWCLLCQWRRGLVPALARRLARRA